MSKLTKRELLFKELTKEMETKKGFTTVYDETTGEYFSRPADEFDGYDKEDMKNE